MENTELMTDLVHPVVWIVSSNSDFYSYDGLLQSKRVYIERMGANS
jgi:hypothetical protein